MCSLFSAISHSPFFTSNDRGSGIFKTAAIYVLRKEKRLLTTGQITRYITTRFEFERKKREREKNHFSFLFQFSTCRMPHLFFYWATLQSDDFFRFRFAFLLLFFVYFFFHFHIRDATRRRARDERETASSREWGKET